VKIRLWGTAEECTAAAERLMRTPGLVVLSVSEPYADRGTSVLVRVFVEARLDPPPPSSTSRPRPAPHAAGAAGRSRQEATSREVP